VRSDAPAMSTRMKWLVAIGLCTAAHGLFATRAVQASCIAPLSCVCESWPAVHVFQARLGDLDDGRAQVEVLDVLATDEEDPIRAGAVIEGELELDTCDVATPELAAGDEVLALWRGWPKRTLLDCAEYADCMQGACASSTEAESCSACLDAARIECPREADLPRLVLIRWGPELDLGDGRVLASDDAGLLGNLDQCLARFPAPPPEPCDDAIAVGVSDACTTSVPGGAARSGALASIGLLLCAAWLRRRRVPR